MRQFILKLAFALTCSILMSLPVFAGYEALVYPTQEVVKVGTEAVITIKLTDGKGLGLSGHLLRLFSSSDDDVVKYFSSNVTNSKGEMNFVVSSPTKGVSTYTIYDLTEDRVLDSRVKLSYFDTASSLLGNMFASAGNSSGPIDGFEFKDLPQTINTSESVSFGIKAVDANKEVVTSYLGKVRFSLVDGNKTYVTLPPDYTFTADDLGEHTFSLGLIFSQPGTYTLEVRDLDSLPISGEHTFTVSVGTGSSSAATIKLLSPVAGTYSNGVQVITGTAQPGAMLRIFDNDVKLADIVVGIEGTFTYTTPVLQDGTHKIYIAEVNQIGTVKSTSGIIEVSIDSSAPDASTVTLDPTGPVAAGSSVKVKLTSKDKLSSAKLTLLGNAYELFSDGTGAYSTTFQAPSADGVYALNFTLVDELGNETKFESDVSLKVGGLLANGLIGDVVNLKTKASDRRITLNWDAPVVHVNPIKNYRVFYGDSPANLSTVVDTFTAGTTWYIPNLQNGMMYYFAVSAVDDKGNVSDHMSNISSAIPSAILSDTSVDVLGGTAGGDAYGADSDISDTGPEVVFVLLLSVLGGFLYVYSLRRKSLI